MDLETTPFEYEPIDLEGWPRKEHFEFFSPFAEPFFSITAEVECGGLIERCRQQSRSVTYGLWHGVLMAAREVSEFSTRILQGRPVQFPHSHLSPTVLREDKTFGVGFVPFTDDPGEFEHLARRAVAQVQASCGFQLGEQSRRIDLIHFSTVPWFRFTGLTHARPQIPGESEPKVTLGRFAEVEPGQYLIAVSITAHHGLVDGYHVARYLEVLERLWA